MVQLTNDRTRCSRAGVNDVYHFPWSLMMGLNKLERLLLINFLGYSLVGNEPIHIGIVTNVD
jgi:hypothetical protein